MIKSLAAAAIALSGTFAEAQQQCMTREEIKESWSHLNTNREFLGLSDHGVMVEIFVNPDVSRWSIWFTKAADTNTLCLLDQGDAANTASLPFTRPLEPTF